MPDPIVKTVTVPLPPEKAFEVFTKGMGDWWPLDSHSLSAQEDGVPARDITVTPEKGGPVYETKPDGSTAPWGTVTEWAPGKSFAMTWHVGRPEEQASHVSIRFDVVADGTKVTLVHDNWQALGAEAAALRGTYHAGWQMIFLQGYAKACAAVLALA